MLYIGGVIDPMEWFDFIVEAIGDASLGRTYFMVNYQFDIKSLGVLRKYGDQRTNRRKD